MARPPAPPDPAAYIPARTYSKAPPGPLLDHLITHREPLHRAPEVYRMIQRGGTDWLGIVLT